MISDIALTEKLDSGTSYGATNLRKKFTFSFLSLFFILYWLPLAVNYIAYVLAYVLFGRDWEFIHYIYSIECDIVFFGYHSHIPHVIAETDSFLGYQALLASIIIAVVLSAFALMIDHKHLFISRLKAVSYPYFYICSAKIISLVMIFVGLDKFFPIQFSGGLSPDALLSPVSVLDSHELFWISYGSSEYYEMFLGALEVLGAILLWSPRFLLLGSIIISIVMVNIVIMDVLCNVYVRVFSILILSNCIFFLWPELRHYYQYFVHGRLEQRTVLVHSLISKISSRTLQITLRGISAVICLAYTIAVAWHSYHTISHVHSAIKNRLYGVWDSTARGVYLGNHSLETLGIMCITDKATIALYKYNSDGSPDVIKGKPGSCTKDFTRISFSLTDDAAKSIQLIGNIVQDRLVVHYQEASKMINITYHHRKFLSRRYAPNLFKFTG